jgi:hypothetical protein
MCNMGAERMMGIIIVLNKFSLFFISENEAIWLAEEPFRAGRFFASGPLWNATARCEM